MMPPSVARGRKRMAKGTLASRKKAAVPLCAVSWCLSAVREGSKHCAVHDAYPHYKPTPATGDLGKTWAAVPVEKPETSEHAEPTERQQQKVG